MINIILFLIILSIFLYFCSPLLKNNEGLDNCDTPPIKGSTSTDITNSHQISTLQQQLSDLDSHLRQQVSTNTAQINNIDTINKDTFKNKSEFFSARRALKNKEDDYGRNISIIMLK